jgi:transposase
MKTRVEAGGESCRAVLAVWAEKRSVKQVCGELGISEKVFQLWQERAMEGMLKALEPREGREEERGPALSPRLKRLLERKASEQEGRLPRLTKRLAVLSAQPETTAAPG